MIGDENFCASISKIHQVSKNLLLIHRIDEDWQDWTLIRPNGSLKTMSAELLDILSDICDVESFHTDTGYCNLLITYRASRDAKLIERVLLVELD